MCLKIYLKFFFILLICWALLVWPFQDSPGIIEKWMLGILVCAFISYLELRNVSKNSLHFPLSPLRLYWFIRFIIKFAYLMVIANLDVAYRVMHPDLPINPGIVMVKTELKHPLGRLMLANAITLTPGTLVVEMTDDGYLFIHWINVISKEENIIKKTIVLPFEIYLKKAFD